MDGIHVRAFARIPRIHAIQRLEINCYLPASAFHIRYSIPTEVDFIPYFFAGPSFGVLMTAKYEVVNIEKDIKDDLKNLDYCFVFGAGADYTIGAGRLLFDIRYSFGLTTIVDEDDDEYSEAKNTGIMFMVGYGYSF